MNLYSQIKKISLKKCIASLLVCILTILAVFLLPISSVLNPVSVDDIWTSGELKAGTYISTKFDKLYYTGYNVSSYSDLQYGYYYSLNDNSCIFVVLPVSDNPDTELTDTSVKGVLVGLSSDSSFNLMLDNFSQRLNWNSTGIRTMSKSYFIDSSKSQQTPVIIALAILILVFLYSLFTLTKWSIRYFKPALYPMCPHMKISNMDAMLKDLDEQLDKHLINRQGDLYLTSKFLVEYSNKRILVIPLSTVAWAYRMGTLNQALHQKHPRFNLFLILFTGNSIVIQNKEGEHTRLILESMKDTGSIILGYTEEKRRAAKKIVKAHNQARKDKRKNSKLLKKL